MDNSWCNWNGSPEGNSFISSYFDQIHLVDFHDSSTEYAYEWCNWKNYKLLSSIYKAYIYIYFFFPRFFILMLVGMTSFKTFITQLLIPPMSKWDFIIHYIRKNVHGINICKSTGIVNSVAISKPLSISIYLTELTRERKRERIIWWEEFFSEKFYECSKDVHLQNYLSPQSWQSLYLNFNLNLTKRSCSIWDKGEEEHCLSRSTQMHPSSLFTFE